MAQNDSLQSGLSLGADIVQIHLGTPRQWKDTKEPSGDLFTPFYVHAPYLINISSAEHIFKSEKLLLEQSHMAAQLGAEGLVIHGGSWKRSDIESALDRWCDVFNDVFPVPILIENSASGRHSLTRFAEDFHKLWEAVGGQDRDDVGWCLDLAHLWAASDHPVTELRDMLDHLGPPALIHANGSGALMGSKMDRHSPWAASISPQSWMVACIELSRCEDLIVESKDPESDILNIRDALNV